MKRKENRKVFRLSPHEALVLRIIFANIGGNAVDTKYGPATSRATVEKMNERLNKMFPNLPHYSAIAHHGGIFFSDNLKTTLASRLR